MVAATVELVTASRALEVTAPQVSHRLGKYVSMPDKIMIPLAPRPGLEPGTCGLTVRRSTN
jgi:hypothetical protein